MKALQKGFTLIELMIVVAIVGILAAIALPAYQDYTVRAKMSELMTFAAAAKTSVSEFYQSQGYMPSNYTSAGISNVANPTKYISSQGYNRASVTNAVITITANRTNVGTAIPAGSGITFTGAASASAGGIVNWTCATSGGLQVKYVPAICR